jgi:hypothetical protein
MISPTWLNLYLSRRREVAGWRLSPDPAISTEGHPGDAGGEKVESRDSGGDFLAWPDEWRETARGHTHKLKRQGRWLTEEVREDRGFSPITQTSGVTTIKT